MLADHVLSVFLCTCFFVSLRNLVICDIIYLIIIFLICKRTGGSMEHKKVFISYDLKEGQERRLWNSQ